DLTRGSTSRANPRPQSRIVPPRASGGPDSGREFPERRGLEPFARVGGERRDFDLGAAQRLRGKARGPRPGLVQVEDHRPRRLRAVISVTILDGSELPGTVDLQNGHALRPREEIEHEEFE